MRIHLLYKDRRREGSTPLRQCQFVELHLLEVVKKICEDHKLHYWLCGGTMLGALRHKGFIPWDDDLDVFMLKSEFNLFLKYACEELPKDVFLDMPEDAEAFRQENNLIRLRDNYSTGIIRHNKRLYVNDHHGINIDLFLLEEGGAKSPLTVWLLHKYMSNRGWYRRSCHDTVNVANLIKKWALYLDVCFLGLFWKTIQICVPKKRCFLQTNFYTAWRWWFPQDWFVRPGISSRMAEFEGIRVPVPFEAEKILEMQFGDWRQLPSKENQKGYLGVVLPFTPCMHPAAMQYPYKGKAIVTVGGTLIDELTGECHD